MDNIHSHTVHAINGVDVDLDPDIDYYLSGRRLVFSSSVALSPKSEEFGFIDIEYHS